EDRSLSIRTVRRGNELVAVAPFVVRPRSLSHARPLPVVEFLGSGFVGSDYLDVIMQRSALEARQALISDLAHDRLPLKWNNVRMGDNAVSGVLSGLTARGGSGTETKTNTCPFIPL